MRGGPWFWRGMRLSVVVGLVAAGWHAWSVWERYRSDVDSSVRREITYRCAARQSEETLKPRMNEMGNINVNKLCTAGDDFFVSLAELEKVRDGTMDFGPYSRPVDWPGTAITGIFWTLATIITTIALVGFIQMIRWVWGK